MHVESVIKSLLRGTFSLSQPRPAKTAKKAGKHSKEDPINKTVGKFGVETSS